MHPEMLEHFMEALDLPGLRQLKMDTIYGISSTDWLDYDYRRMLRLLETSSPELEVFECVRMGGRAYRAFVEPFDSFKSLKRLRTLRIDLDLLGYWRASFEPSDPQELFPASLQNLAFTEIEVLRLNFLEEHYSANPDQDENEVYKLLRILESTALKECSLYLVLTVLFAGDDEYNPFSLVHQSLRPATLILLLNTADKLARVGTTFRVYGDADTDAEGGGLLVGPGFVKALQRREAKPGEDFGGSTGGENVTQIEIEGQEEIEDTS
ncbi:hypothetical protein BU26DRAFT_559305 [Trematosphaeria pertusa]|uniref:F-box domain-containing protein n=1 Tax=Trematosphaeria pertusa TaxID=390896 RepID=A0A6A6IW55_9PLEO|nr:uncharacterized protein BU26DRAFT_559305 [Trematosphaeria pertusa]KAF2254634.1 hypothetical protein BU26DRAFT_559305 [Trematosphaeria pertusa]